MSNEQIIVDGIKAGKSKNVILAEMLRADEAIDLVKAGQLYQEVGTKEGLLMSKEDKEALVATVANEHTTDGKLDRETAVAALMDKATLSKASATTRLKEYCKTNKIEFPAALRTKRDMDAVKNAYKTWWDEGVERAQIEAGLVEHFGYGEKSVGQAYVKIGKELGLIESGAAQGRIEMAAWFATAANVEGTKAEIVARYMEASGTAKATAETRYGMFLFAIEYAKAVGAVKAA